MDTGGGPVIVAILGPVIYCVTKRTDRIYETSAKERSALVEISRTLAA
jgi:hypothetical protein